MSDDEFCDVDEFQDVEEEGEIGDAFVDAGDGESDEVTTILWHSVGYFLTDIGHDFWWLVELAHQRSADDTSIIRGDEKIDAGLLDDLVASLKSRSLTSVGLKCTCVMGVGQSDLELLKKLSNMRFHCKGRIEVFTSKVTDVAPDRKTVVSQGLYDTFNEHMQKAEPEWVLPMDNGDPSFVQSIASAPIKLDRSNGSVKILGVWNTDRKGGQWSILTTDVCYAHDKSPFDVVKRAWQEQIAPSLGGSFEEDLSADDFMIHIRDPNLSMRYYSRVYLFPQATQALIDRLQACAVNDTGKTEDKATTLELDERHAGCNVFKLPRPTTPHIHKDDLTNAKLVHTDGVPFIQYEELGWMNLDMRSMKLSSPDGRSIRRDCGDMCKSSQKLQAYFCQKLGVKLDLGEQVLSVLLRGIDKKVVPQDIEDFFTDFGCSVKKIEFLYAPWPKHSARVDFADGDSVKNAFRGDGKSLGRRKVGVQEYVDLRILLAGAPPEAADIPIGGPFKVAVSGFDPLCDEDEIYSGLKKMISEQSEEEVEFKDQTITLFPEHSCVLEFNTLAGCITSFKLHGQSLSGFKLKVTAVVESKEKTASVAKPAARERPDRPERKERRPPKERGANPFGEARAVSNPQFSPKNENTPGNSNAYPNGNAGGGDGWPGASGFPGATKFRRPTNGSGELDWRTRQKLKEQESAECL